MNPALVTINTGALAHNLNIVRNAAPDSRVLAVVKADGYGHGLEAVAAGLDGVDGFAVARVLEAIRLRESGFIAPILLLEGIRNHEELQACKRHDLALVIHSERQLQLIASESQTAAVPSWVKIDTGMNRLGLAPDRGVEIWRQLVATGGNGGPPGLMTHLSSADDREDPETARQIERFYTACGSCGADFSIANSGAILGWPECLTPPNGSGLGTAWLRPGIMLYGISPYSDTTAEAHGLRPVMTFVSELIAIRDVAPGESVGYGHSWVATRRSRIGTVATGYGDGYPRAAPTGTPVLVNDVRVSLVGRVSMDMISIDLTDHPTAAVGDAVTLWGERLPVEEVARRAGTIAYELVTRITARVERRVATALV